MALILRGCASGWKSRCMQTVCAAKFNYISFKQSTIDVKRSVPASSYALYIGDVKITKDMPPHIKEVYTGYLAPQIRSIKLLTLTTSTIGLVLQPILYTKVIQTDNFSAALGVLMFIGACITFSPIFFHLITRRYVVDIYYNSQTDKYLATLYSLFVRKKEIEFSPRDVEIPDIEGVLTTCIIKGTPAYLDPKGFCSTDHYLRIMESHIKPDATTVNADDSTNKNKKPREVKSVLRR